MAKTKRSRSTRSPSGLSLNHAIVYVRDLGRALRFYQDLLGLRLIEKFEGSGGPGYARLASARGRTTVALHEPELGETLPERDGIRLYFEVQDLEKLCERLAAAGVEFLQRPQTMPWGWKHAYLKDPDGHELSLYWAGAKRFRRTPGR